MRDNDGYRPVLAALVLCRSVPLDRSKMYAPRKLIDCPTTNENLTNALRSCVAHHHGPPVNSNTHAMESFSPVLNLTILQSVLAHFKQTYSTR